VKQAVPRIINCEVVVTTSDPISAVSQHSKLTPSHNSASKHQQVLVSLAVLAKQSRSDNGRDMANEGGYKHFQQRRSSQGMACVSVLEHGKAVQLPEKLQKRPTAFREWAGLVDLGQHLDASVPKREDSAIVRKPHPTKPAFTESRAFLIEPGKIVGFIRRHAVTGQGRYRHLVMLERSQVEGVMHAR
jgi:hypothetical protein